MVETSISLQKLTRTILGGRTTFRSEEELGSSKLPGLPGLGSELVANYPATSGDKELARGPFEILSR